VNHSSLSAHLATQATELDLAKNSVRLTSGMRHKLERAISAMFEAAEELDPQYLTLEEVLPCVRSL